MATTYNKQQTCLQLVQRSATQSNCRTREILKRNPPLTCQTAPKSRPDMLQQYPPPAATSRLDQVMPHPIRRRRWIFHATTMALMQLALFCAERNPAQLFVAAQHYSTANRTAVAEFVEQPRDTYALMGQSALINCVLANKKGLVFWSENNNIVASENWPADSKEPREMRVSDWPADNEAKNYALLIKRAKNDVKYKCKISSLSSGATLESREISFRVVKAPEVLQIRLLSPATHRAHLPPEAAQNNPFAATDSTTTTHTKNNSDDNAADDGDNNGVASDEMRRPKVNEQRLSFGSSDSADADADTSAANGTGNGDGNGNDIELVVVRQNTRAKLECVAQNGLPRAQLTWLDHNNQSVRATNGSNEVGEQQSSSLASANETVEQFVKVNEANQTTLETSSLVWSFPVSRWHHNRVLSCVARHKAYALESSGGRNNNNADEEAEEERIRRVRLWVEFEPEIELTREPHQLVEGSAAKFTCFARARPIANEFKWFIDNELVLSGANETELRIRSVTRQLSLREIRCEARNELGSTSSVMRVSVQYGPAFVSHLLSASLRPDEMLEPTDLQQTTGSNWQRATLLGKQLALGYELNQPTPIKLRCDFDANPSSLSVAWYKVNTDYRVMANVTPVEADELIAGGAAHAIFKSALAATSGSLLPASQLLQASAAVPQSNPIKRHIVASEPPMDLSIGLSTDAQSYELDYERMSQELLEELKQLERLDSQTAEASGELGVRVLERLDSGAPSKSTNPISEPLGWHIMPLAEHRSTVQLPAAHKSPHHSFAAAAAVAAAGEHGRNSSGQSSKPTIVSKVLELSGRPIVHLSGLDASAPARLNQRQAMLTSSNVEIERADEDSMGKYVCVARTSGPPVSAPTTTKTTSSARAVYLVMKQPPRIVSKAIQTATLGASVIQVECLAQISTVQDNLTSFTWSKDLKPIDVQQVTQASSAAHPSQDSSSPPLTPSGQRATKVTTIIEQLSPDLLFMRSILRLNGADLSDFGQYNCTIRNLYGSDSMLVHLQPTAPTGFYFVAMASLTIGAIMVFVCATGAAMIPCNRLDSVAKAAALAGERAASFASGGSNRPTTKANATALATGSEQVQPRRNKQSMAAAAAASGDSNSCDKSTTTQANDTMSCSQSLDCSATSSMVITGSVAGARNQVDSGDCGFYCTSETAADGTGSNRAYNNSGTHLFKTTMPITTTAAAAAGATGEPLHRPESAFAMLNSYSSPSHYSNMMQPPSMQFQQQQQLHNTQLDDTALYLSRQQMQQQQQRHNHYVVSAAVAANATGRYDYDCLDAVAAIDDRRLASNGTARQMLQRGSSLRHNATSSLQRPIHLSSMISSSDKFAAIQESLEHKLQFELARRRMHSSPCRSSSPAMMSQLPVAPAANQMLNGADSSLGEHSNGSQRSDATLDIGSFGSPSAILNPNSNLVQSSSSSPPNSSAKSAAAAANQLHYHQHHYQPKHQAHHHHHHSHHSHQSSRHDRLASANSTANLIQDSTTASSGRSSSQESGNGYSATTPSTTRAPVPSLQMHLLNAAAVAAAAAKQSTTNIHNDQMHENYSNLNMRNQNTNLLVGQMFIRSPEDNNNFDSNALDNNLENAARQQQIQNDMINANDLHHAAANTTCNSTYATLTSTAGNSGGGSGTYAMLISNGSGGGCNGVDDTSALDSSNSYHDYDNDQKLYAMHLRSATSNNNNNPTTTTTSNNLLPTTTTTMTAAASCLATHV